MNKKSSKKIYKISFRIVVFHIWYKRRIYSVESSHTKTHENLEAWSYGASHWTSLEAWCIWKSSKCHKIKIFLSFLYVKESKYTQIRFFFLLYGKDMKRRRRRNDDEYSNRSEILFFFFIHINFKNSLRNRQKMMIHWNIKCRNFSLSKIHWNII